MNVGIGPTDLLASVELELLQVAGQETFRTTDPDAPTLCEGWNVRRLLAHLTQREHSLIARIVDSVARKSPGQEPGLNKLTSQAETPRGYDALIDRFTQGAPHWSPMSWAADRLNFVE